MPSPHAVVVARPLYVSITSRGTTKVTPPIPKEACVQDRHPRDGPRNKPTELCVEDHRGSVNPRKKFRPPPTLADLRTRTRTG
ncbi:hypothetical protein B296_00023982 [Ensete ventricosum]|uniref:Uncharacterized protein n=1 Tax=Ensete ventricosum TaxID=4639 RepID=A0A426YH65_ENSVE|nr:hypothetical protein B296_00023982 [Ensete ventricosum]